MATSKEILALPQYIPAENLLLPNFGIPTQIGNVNYYVLVSDIIALITKASLQLGSVDNTSDANKPVSTLQAQALAQKAALNHAHQISEVNGLAQALADKFGVNAMLPIAQVTGLVEVLLQKAEANHNHAIADITNLVTTLAGKSPTGHVHVLANITDFAAYAQSVVAALNERPTTAQVETMIAEMVVADAGEW